MLKKFENKYLILKVLALALLLMVKQITYAQTTVAISDTAFLNVLKKELPQVIDANNKLIVAQAKAYTGLLTIKNSNIQNIDEIQYFESVTKLTVTETKLTIFPSIANLKNLQILRCITNKLTQFPDFSKNTKIQEIQCNNNQITSLPNIANLDSLQVIDISNNYIKTLPLLTNLPNLKSIILFNNDISAINSLANLPKLQVLMLENNSLTSLDNIYNIQTLTNLNVMSNNLSFLELNKLKTHTAFSSFLIFPQDTVDKVKNMQFFALKPKAIRLNNVPNPIDYDFDWYKNGIYLKTVNGVDSLYFTNLLLSDTCKYTCVVKCTNSTSPYFSKSVTYNVVNLKFGVCKNFNSVSYQITNKDCKTGTNIVINENFDLGAYGPFIYTLKNDTSITSQTYTSNQISNLSTGLYAVTIQDINKNCQVNIPSSIKIDTIAGCTAKTVIINNENNIFTPNGDGKDDSYFIDVKGSAHIYNRSGKLIKTLTTPSTWDGTDHNGVLQDLGYYVIIIKGEIKQYITLVQ